MIKLPPYKLRYEQAHRLHQEREYPATVRDFGWLATVFPDTRKSNGLTRFIVNYLLWTGHNATRISVSGRLIDAAVKQPSGVSLMTKKWIPGPTRRGRADIDSTVKIKSGFGIPVKWEIKCGTDTPSEHQLAEQAREVSAGGHYYFIHGPEEFFEILDKILIL